MKNRKAVVLTAVIAVLETLRNRPDKQQLLICDSFYPLNDNAIPYTNKMMSSSVANPEKNYLIPLQFYHHKEILKIADGVYDRFLKIAVNNTLYPLTTTSDLQ